MVKFLERKETDGILLRYCPGAETKSLDDLTLDMKRQGALNLGYHYVLRRGGELEKGIPLGQYANPEITGADRNIVVLVTSASLTDAQRLSLDGLSSRLGLPVRGEDADV